MNNEELDRIFHALSNSKRRVILSQLAEGQATVSQLAASFPDISLPAISKHIKVLEKAKLIDQGINAQYRPCKINGTTVNALSAWVETTSKLWTQRFNQLDDYLLDVRTKEELDE